MTERYFFDLPVYRLSQEEREAEGIKYVMNTVFPLGTLHGDILREQAHSEPDEYQRKLSQTLHSYHGGPWIFNEIIGYIKLHFVGTQIRGEYFAPSRKRIIRSRIRDFQFQTWKLAPEVEIAFPITSEAIYQAVGRYIDACRLEIPRRYIDSTLFDSISPHINWLQLYRAVGDA